MFRKIGVSPNIKECGWIWLQNGAGVEFVAMNSGGVVVLEYVNSQRVFPQFFWR